MTGTPIENTPDDLVGIFEFLSPGYLRPGMGAKRLSELVREHILRRTKDMVLTDLPPKMFREAELDLTPEQRASYEMAENEGVMRLNEMGDCNHHSARLRTGFAAEANLQLRPGNRRQLKTGAADGRPGRSRRQRQKGDRLQPVGQVHRDPRAISCSGLARSNITARFPRSSATACSSSSRKTSPKHVILMSYGAGSVGLNLQFCEYVFLFDRWWNPAVEDQAINRAHRIGAAGPVTVTRMLSLATIEERINEVLEHKRGLFAQIIGENSAPASLGLSQPEIFGLFNLRTPKGVLRPAA